MHNIHSPEDHTDEVAELKEQYTAIDKLLAMIKQRSDNSATYKEYQERSAFTQKHFRKKNAGTIDAYEEADKYIKEHIKDYYIDGKAPKRSELAALSKQLKDKRKAIMPEHKAYLLKHETAMRYTRQVRQYLNEQYMKREREKSRQRTQAKHRNKNALEERKDDTMSKIGYIRVSTEHQETQTALNSGLCLTMCVRVTRSTSRVSAV